MKKIKLIILSLLITTFCHAQSYNKIYKTTFMRYVNREWVDVESNYPQKMFVILKNDIVTITNEAETKIVTYGTPEKKFTDDGQTWSWDAYDEEGSRCKFVMKQFYDSKNSIFTLAYFQKNIAFQYITNND